MSQACVTTEAASDSEDHRPEDGQYEALLAGLRTRFSTIAGPLFTTAPPDDGLFATFIEALPAARRQHYTCHACRRFVDRFGGLVTIAPDGTTTPALWDVSGAPPFFRPAVRAVARLVSRARVNGVFLCDERVWGLPNNASKKPPGIWHHMAVTPPAALVYRPGPLLSTSQVMAEKLQDHGILCRGLAEFPIDAVKQAVTLLQTEALYRSEKCLGVATWLLKMHEARGETKNARARDNIAWLAVATAPPGFCHVRSTMIGTLLEDIAAGKSFDDVSRAFASKMHPLQYQRPTALSRGQIEQAEKVVATLASAGSLARRFARLEDVQALWKPSARSAPAEADGGGVFAHLKPRGAASRPPATPIEAPPTTITWEKFARTVLPDAERIELLVPHGMSPFSALVTAVNPDAPPILQWDRDDKRNPVSWYFYNGGSTPEHWALKAGAHVDVTAVCLQPTMWDPDRTYAHQGAKVFFLLDGARDTKHERSGGFFPETLRSEYHAVRAAMEAYANAARVEGRDEATACGLALQRGATWNAVVRVTSRGSRVSYRLDRWD